MSTVAVTLAAKWWADKIREVADTLGDKDKEIYTQNSNGSVKAICIAPTNEQINDFEKNLKLLLKKNLAQTSNTPIILDCILGVSGLLDAAAEKSGLDGLLFPENCKMTVTHNSVYVCDNFHNQKLL